jgi:DNA mismatch repair protein MutS
VIADARRTLALLEKGMHPASVASRREEASPQLGLFAPPAPSALEKRLAEIDPDALSPREALEVLYRLKALG